MKRLLIGTLVAALGIGAFGTGTKAHADNYDWAGASWALAGVMATSPHYSRRAPRYVTHHVVRHPPVVYVPTPYRPPVYRPTPYHPPVIYTRPVRCYPTVGVRSVTYYNGYRGYPQGYTVHRVNPPSSRQVYRTGSRHGYYNGRR